MIDDEPARAAPIRRTVIGHVGEPPATWVG